MGTIKIATLPQPHNLVLITLTLLMMLQEKKKWGKVVHRASDFAQEVGSLALAFSLFNFHGLCFCSALIDGLVRPDSGVYLTASPFPSPSPSPPPIWHAWCACTRHTCNGNQDIRMSNHLDGTWHNKTDQMILNTPPTYCISFAWPSWAEYAHGFLVQVAQ